MVVEDDESLRRQLRWALESDYKVIEAGSTGEAIALSRAQRPPVVTLDLGLPPHAESTVEGFTALDALLELDPHVRVIVITGNRDRESAVRAIARGAYDYFEKPIELTDLRLMVGRAHRVRALEDEGVARALPASHHAFGSMLGACPEMREVFAMIHRVADTTASVLITGESGTGKELVAREIHAGSRRSAGPFVALNCSAIPETLIESELFGHEKGAFTGAHVQRRGWIEAASGGTLFLDELNDMPATVQAKLLRVVQERHIERVGGRTPIPVDVRPIAATSLEPQSAIASGRLRLDLFYRLGVVSIALPPLRRRQDDVLLLARAFLDRLAAEHARPVKRFAADAEKALAAHAWPGNVRELENRVRRAVIMAAGQAVSAEDLELAAPGESTRGGALKEHHERVDRALVNDALQRAGGNVSQAARQLGISRPALYDRLRRFGLRATGDRRGR